MHADVVSLFLCGDVMLGRGVDQILPHHGDPTLRESYVDDARTYVALAERANGPIPRPVDVFWPWGDALQVLRQAAPAVRIINLETTITRSDGFASGKAIHYRMHPDNIACLVAGRPDICTLANNHVLDFGVQGLEETLDVLSAVGLRGVGAGGDPADAQRPAVVPLQGGGRVLLFACGLGSSGIPAQWAVSQRRPGVAYVAGPSEAVAAGVLDSVRRVKQPDDLVVVSLHWGSNWGYAVSSGETDFAHTLIDGGVDVVHGHSSHHPRPVEVYRDKLILYGCGDFINDYEGIPGHEEYRGDLRLLYLPSVRIGSGALTGLRMIPMQARRMRLEHASNRDARWLRSVLDRISSRFGTGVGLEQDGELTLLTS